MSPDALTELRDGLLNAAAAAMVDAGTPQGADRWADAVTDAAVAAILPDVARTLEVALTRELEAARPTR